MRTVRLTFERTTNCSLVKFLSGSESLVKQDSVKQDSLITYKFKAIGFKRWKFSANEELVAMSCFRILSL